MNPKVDQFLNRITQWQDEISQLRRVMLNCQLTEELKWGQPCYTFEKSNIVILQNFKNYCAILFVKGVLLKDEKNVLVALTENTQSSRQIRFTNLQEILNLEPVIKAYVNQAIEIEKAGLKVEYKKTSAFNVPDELQAIFDEIPELKTAFEALTPGRQRAYLLYFDAPKQSKTRTARVEKYMQHILSGKGLND